MRSQPLYNGRPAPSRPPLGLFLSVALAALILVGGVLGWLAWQFQQLPPIAATVLRVAVFVLPILLVSAAAIVGLVLVYNRWARPEMIKADKVTDLTRATVQRFPPTLTSLSYHDSSRPQFAPPAMGEDTPLLSPPETSIPSFGELLDQGKIGPARPLILGYNAETGTAIEGTWEDLYSTGVGGMTGSGKSWLVAFLAGQSAAANARIILIDPHSGDPQSLATRLAPLSASYMCDVASTPTEITSALKLASDKLENRKAGKGGTSWGILLIVDEWTSLLRSAKLSDQLTATALAYAEEGRKFGCFALLAAQGWQVEAAGPVRDRLASHFTMRTRGDQFRYQMGLRGSAPLDTLFLKPGQAYFLSTRGELGKVQIPRMEPADLARCATLIDRPAAALGQPFGFGSATRPVTPSAQIVAENRPECSQNVAAPVSATTASGPATVASPEAARAAALFVAGSSPADIVKELRGIGSKEGSRYQAALNDVLNLIRAGMGGA